MEKTIEYKGFKITKDDMLGYSLIGKSGCWCSSNSSMQAQKDSVDKILTCDLERLTEQRDMLLNSIENGNRDGYSENLIVRKRGYKEIVCKIKDLELLINSDAETNQLKLL